MTTLFIGLRVPDDVRTALQSALGPVWARGHDLAWTRPAGWHVTLAHLADTTLTPADVAEVVAAAAADVTPPSLTIANSGTWFDRALVLAVAEDPSGWCDRLAGRLRTGLPAAGEDVDGRTVRPHVTLARRRGGARRDSLSLSGLELPRFGLPRWRPTAVEVFESVTGDGPAHYPVRASVSLV